MPGIKLAVNVKINFKMFISVSICDKLSSFGVYVLLAHNNGLSHTNNVMACLINVQIPTSQLTNMEGTIAMFKQKQNKVEKLCFPIV